MPPKFLTFPEKIHYFGGGFRMNLDFDFTFPTGEEIKIVKELAEFNPEMIDGREMWILQNFVGDEL